MRFFFLFLLLISFGYSQNITYFLNVSSYATCPDNILVMNATASNGEPGAGIELRVVLHFPYQGLRAVQTTHADGIAKAELTKPGLYRIYIKTEDYNHPYFVEFNYSELCPPPPPKTFNISVVPDCNQSLLRIYAMENATPVQDAFISIQEWSSTTSKQGVVVFPLQEGYVYVTANKTGFTRMEFWEEVNCTPVPPPPPPECLEDANCSSTQVCANETCIDITGECGYAENHSWVSYECCEDDDCGYRMLCEDNSCVIEPPKENISEQNQSDVEIEEPPKEEDKTLYAYAIATILVAILLYYKYAKK